MDALRKERGNLKSRITRIETTVKTNTDSGTSWTENTIKLNLEKIEVIIRDLNELQRKFYLQAKDQTELDPEEVEIADMEGRLDTLKLKFWDEAQPAPSVLIPTTIDHTPRSSVAGSAGPGPEIRLPRLDLPSFNGSRHEWLSFHDLFRAAVHANDRLSPAQKLQYLKIAVKGEAATLIQAYQITDDNYDEAWRTLVARYEDKRELVNSNFERLLGIQPIQTENPVALQKMFDKTKECIRCVDILNIPREKAYDLLVIHLLSKKLDSESRLQWERTIKADEIPSLEEFLNFGDLQARITAAAKSSGKSKPPQESKKQGSAVHHGVMKSTSKQNCPICNDSHLIYHCKQFKDLPVEEKWKVVKTKQLCFNCLSNTHRINQCKSSSCRICEKKHHSLLHDKEALPKPSAGQQNKSEETAICNHFFSNRRSKGLLSTALIRIRNKAGEFELFRALLDCGSESSFVTTNCVTRLGLRRHKVQIPLSGLAGTDAGTSKEMVEISFSSSHGYEPIFKIHGLILKTVTSDLPTTAVKRSDWSHLRGLQLADPYFQEPQKIDVLLGADIYYELLEPGKKIGPPGTPIALNTALGWIVGGKLDGREQQESVSTFTVRCDLESTLKKFWEVEEMPRQRFLTQDEKTCEAHFAATHSRTESGRFVVRLPIKENEKPLGDSRSMAVRRFKSGERRNLADPIRQQIYQDVMEEYLTLGHMELVPSESLQSPRTYYMPHHAVENLSSSTTPFRVVFDASATSSSGVSLNQNLLVGPKLQDDLVSILIRFRQHKIAFTADIPKMYRQVLVHPDDIDLQRIVWRKNPNEPLRDYRMLTATFGTAAAPYLAIKSIQQLAEYEKDEFLEAANTVSRDFYVDDLMSGAATVENAVNVQQQLMKLLERGGMGLRKWSSNCEEFLSSLPHELKESKAPFNIEEDQQVKTLGLQWHPRGDYFSFKVCLSDSSSYFTKRSVLSEISKIFDPLGWLSPVIISAKIFMQQMWKEELGWDDRLPSPLAETWKVYRNQLTKLQEVKIPRFISQENSNQHQLYGFCDASEVAYAAVVFLYTRNEHGNSTVRMVAAKSKVAPTKIVSLPRLELCGAVLLVRLLQVVKNSLTLQIDKVVAWTDSTIVLAWLSSPPHRWKTFVANRVSEILDFLPRESWQHVKSEENPADCASRGISPSSLIESQLWWTGPSWLLTSDSPCSQSSSLENIIAPEERAVVNVLHAAIEECLLFRYSDLSKLLRITAYCLRVLKRRNPNQKQTVPSPISADEMNTAMMTWVKKVQAEEFPNEISALQRKQAIPHGSKLKTLSPFLDDFGILRVGGRLQKADVHFDVKHQIILPKKHYFTQLVISKQHEKDLHAGPQALLASIQQKFWILSGRDVVRHFVRKCVKCCRFRAQCAQQKMGELPSARITPASPFLRTGVDYAGPFSVTARKGRGQRSFKSYIAVFVCMVSRAIHLELVSDMTTEAFLAALRRFISRRGKPTDLYSDCGTNFVGAKKIFDDHLKLVSSTSHNLKLQESLAADSITWHLNPAAAPTFGGIWESAVKSMKYHLRRVVGVAILTIEEMRTLLAQVEACLNSRPITELSSDPADLLPLTPGHFLIGRPLTALPDSDLTHLKEGHLSRWQRVQQMYQHFWKRWSKEHLGRLQQRNKWLKEEPNIIIGSLVLIKDENLPPAKWSLGRIIATFPGADKLVRVVTVKTSTGELKRPITKLCILPVELS